MVNDKLLGPLCGGDETTARIALLMSRRASGGEQRGEESDA